MKRWIPYDEAHVQPIEQYYIWSDLPVDRVNSEDPRVLANIWFSLEVGPEWVTSRVYQTEYPVENLEQLFEQAYYYQRQFWPKDLTTPQMMLDWATSLILSPMELLGRGLE